MATRLRDIQYHLVVHQSDSDGGPGQELFELTGEAMNLVWQNVLNLPGNAALTLMRNSRKLPRILFMRHHLKIWREDRNGTILVFAGKLVQPDHGPRDVIVYCWDYLALLQRVIVEYYRETDPKRYASKRIGDVIADPAGTFGSKDLFALAKGKAGSPVAFLTKGTVQQLMRQDGTTPIRTGSSFGFGNLQDTLLAMHDLAEMAMANTTRTVTFETAPDSRTDPTSVIKFNLFSDRHVDRTQYAFTYPGNLADFGYADGYGQVLNRWLTLIRDNSKKHGVAQLAIEADPASAVGRDNLRRLEGAGRISTLVGITNDTADKKGQRLAAQRQARQARRVQRSLVVYPRQGYVTPYDSWQLGDNFRVTVKGSGVDVTTDQLDKQLKLHSVAAAWSAEGGEALQLFLREPET